MFKIVGGEHHVEGAVGQVHGLGGGLEKRHVGAQERAGVGVDVGREKRPVAPGEVVGKLAVSASDVEDAGVAGNEPVEPTAQDVPYGPAPRLAVGKAAAVDGVKGQGLGHQMPPMRICSSIQGMTSSRMASSDVVARNPSIRAAFSTLGTRFCTSYLNGSSETTRNGFAPL